MEVELMGTYEGPYGGACPDDIPQLEIQDWCTEVVARIFSEASEESDLGDPQMGVDARLVEAIAVVVISSTQPEEGANPSMIDEQTQLFTVKGANVWVTAGIYDT